MRRRLFPLLAAPLFVAWAASAPPAKPPMPTSAAGNGPAGSAPSGSAQAGGAPAGSVQAGSARAGDAPAGRLPMEGVPVSTCFAGRALKNVPMLQCELSFEQRRFVYYVYLPPTYDGRRLLPAVLLLHGSGGTGLDSISAWQQLAEANGFLLLAPTLTAGPALESKVHELLHTILASALRERKIDAHRIYLFGHSMGGIFAFDAAMLDAETYAAAAVHAAVIDPDYDWIVKRARRKVPIAIYIGDRDPYFPLDRARRTRDLLRGAGYDLQYVELLHHDHDYNAVAANVNDLAWTFFRRRSLPEGPGHSPP
jgi:predicted esterase